MEQSILDVIKTATRLKATRVFLNNGEPISYVTRGGVETRGRDLRFRDLKRLLKGALPPDVLRSMKWGSETTQRVEGVRSAWMVTLHMLESKDVKIEMWKQLTLGESTEAGVVSETHPPPVVADDDEADFELVSYSQESRAVTTGSHAVAPQTPAAAAVFKPVGVKRPGPKPSSRPAEPVKPSASAAQVALQAPPDRPIALAPPVASAPLPAPPIAPPLTAPGPVQAPQAQAAAAVTAIQLTAPRPGVLPPRPTGGPAMLHVTDQDLKAPVQAAVEALGFGAQWFHGSRQLADALPYADGQLLVVQVAGDPVADPVISALASMTMTRRRGLYSVLLHATLDPNDPMQAFARSVDLICPLSAQNLQPRIRAGVEAWYRAVGHFHGFLAQHGRM